ncbi:MAG: hypothetical protein PF518_06650 [Spirochaetaceae bacterium]|nr:hypothetical protein [Spirochaetaceae bacterium]
MKKYFIPTIIVLILLLNACAIGGLIEADQLEGTWVSDDFYSTVSNTYYVYYDFKSLTVDLFDGDQTGKYRIRGYKDTFWWDTNYQLLEEGTYTTDFISGRITLSPNSSPSRVLYYSLTDNKLTFTDNDWWTSSSIVLRKL